MSEQNHVFVSVGRTFNEAQEAFVCAVEARLRAEGLIPHTVGRDTFSSDAPLKTIMDLMKKCSGTVVIALERSYFPTGFDKPNSPSQSTLTDVKLATPWNQIEAAISYSRGLPLMMLVESGVRPEGLLERGYDWFVQDVTLDTSTLTSIAFNGILASWKAKIQSNADASTAQEATHSASPTDEMTVGQLVGGLKPAQLWAVLVALAGALAASFTLGAKLFHGK
jgi:hypothetical protein